MSGSRYKKTKFGKLPGDLPFKQRVDAVEGKAKSRNAKSFKREFTRIANRRSRRHGRRLCDEYIKGR